MGALDELERAHAAAVANDRHKYMLDPQFARVFDTVPAALTEARAQAARLREVEGALAAAEARATKAEERFASGPPWLADAAEALGNVTPDGKPLSLNWSQVLDGIRSQREKAAAWDRAQAGACVLSEEDLTRLFKAWSERRYGGYQLLHRNDIEVMTDASRETAARIVARLEGVPVHALSAPHYIGSYMYGTTDEMAEAVRRRLLASLTESGAAPGGAVAPSYDYLCTKCGALGPENVPCATCASNGPRFAVGDTVRFRREGGARVLISSVHPNHGRHGWHRYYGHTLGEHASAVGFYEDEVGPAGGEGSTP